MGNCCQSPDKTISKDIEVNLQEVYSPTGQGNISLHSQSHRLHNGSDNLGQQMSMGAEENVALSIGLPEITAASGLMAARMNSSLNLNGTNRQQAQQSENGSMNGYKQSKNPSSRERIGSLRLMEELASLGRVDTQDDKKIEIDDTIARHLVRTREDLNKRDTTRFVFLCRSDSSKSFILTMNDQQAKQAKSVQVLFDIAQKFVLAMYGTHAVGLELLFGPVNNQKPLNEYPECYPAYFRTKEVFEDTYTVKVVQKNDINDKATKTVNLSIFPSMTVNDAKIELLKVLDINTNINGSSLLMLRGGDTANPAWLALLDEDKFGAVAQHHGLEDCFAIVNEADAWSNCVWPVGGVTSIELIGLSPLDEKDERSKRRRVRPGVNIEIACRNDKCMYSQTNESVVVSLGLGVFNLGKSSGLKLACPYCHSEKNIRIIAIAFFQCRFAFTALHQNNTRRASQKWGVIYHPQGARKFELKELTRGSNEVNNWNDALAENQWRHLRLYAKLIAHTSRMHEHDEFLHSLHMDEMTLFTCGVCKANLNHQMIHQLPCGHSFHKICLNLLPKIFENIPCPLCVSRDSNAD